MNIRPIAMGAASVALAGGMVLAGTTAASASTWSCAKGAACGYRTGATKTHSFQRYVNANNLGWANKVKNHGSYEYNRQAVFYFKYIPHGEHDWVYFKKCVTYKKKGHQTYAFSKSHSKEAYVYKLRWVHSC